MKGPFELGSMAIAPVMAMLVVAGCGGSGQPEEETPAAASGETSIVIGVTMLENLYDPGEGAYTYASLNINAVYDSLMILNDEGGFDPWLATDFELSDDRRTLSFTLRDDVTFTDGAPLNAEAVVRNFEYLLASENAFIATRQAVYGYEFTATGEYTLDVTSKAAMDYRGIEVVAVTSPIVSPEAIEDKESLAEQPVGSGPYLLDEVVPEVSAKFERNPEYWNPDAFHFESVELRVFADDVAALNALKSGQIDAAELSIPNAVEAREAGFTVAESPGRFVALWFADRGGAIEPAIGDGRVRQAINLAFDREAINEQLNQGYGAVTGQPFWSRAPEYVHGGDDYYAYDVARARELMAEAGYADGFELIIPSTTFLGINAYEPVVAQSLSEIGIRVEFDQIADLDDYFSRATDGTYPVLLYNEAYTNTVQNYIGADGFWNYLDYVDPAVQGLVDIVRNGTIEESAEASKELGQTVLEQAWLAPIAAPRNLWASAPGIRVDVASGNTGVPYLHNFHSD